MRSLPYRTSGSVLLPGNLLYEQVNYPDIHLLNPILGR
jgi:hypothetical protein